MKISGKQVRFAAGRDEAQQYEMIINSQGNISDTESGSSRYTATFADGADKSRGFHSVPEDETSGPGYKPKEYIEDSEIDGPSVQNITISEEYHEDFGVYEESLGDQQFFYSTVANGGITDESVSIDLPAGIEYVMEKDGVEIPYTSGQTVSDRGSYLLRLTLAEDSSLPFSEQKFYKATFRFRIQERMASASSEETGEVSAGGYGSLIFPEEDTVILETDGETDSELPAKEPEDEQQESPGNVMKEDGEIDSEALEEAVQAALGEGYGTENLEGYNSGTGLSSAYDEESGLYRHELASGEIFFTDVPNGMLTNRSVMLTTNDSLSLRVLRDGEEIEYTQGTEIEKAGSYLIFPHSESTVYLAAYAEKAEPLFHFRIVDGPVSDLGIVTAPQDSTITSVLYNGAEAEYPAGGEWYQTGEDGEYVLNFKTPAAEEEVVFVKDTAAPRYYYSINEGKADFQYVSSDIARSRIIKDGTVIYDGEPVAQIDDPGTYQVEIYDAAGNISSAGLEIAYRMNTAGILVIVLVLILLAALAAFIRRTKKQMKVV